MKIRGLFQARSALLRAGRRREEGIFFFAYPALIPQHASAPRKRTGLLPAVPPEAGLNYGGFKFVYDPLEITLFGAVFS